MDGGPARLPPLIELMDDLVEEAESPGWRKWIICLENMNHLIDEDESLGWKTRVTWMEHILDPQILWMERIKRF